MITTANFLALSLVKCSSDDIIAVCLDRKPDDILCIEFSLNDATAEVLGHANALKHLCKKHLDIPRNPGVWIHFRTEYLIHMVM